MHLDQHVLLELTATFVYILQVTCWQKPLGHSYAYSTCCVLTHNGVPLSGFLCSLVLRDCREQKIVVLQENLQCSNDSHKQVTERHTGLLDQLQVKIETCCLLGKTFVAICVAPKH